jgi:mannose-6-phosphate isomerase-like protein (cupin superfamily)
MIFSFDYQFKIVKLQGDFIWHDHTNTDETFIVLEGTLRIDFRDGAVQISAGEMFVVPKGVEHKRGFKLPAHKTL